MRYPDLAVCRVAAFAVFGALAGCQATPPAAPPETLSFGTAAPLIVAVESIELIEQYQSSSAAPNVEQEFDITPAGALRQLIAARLQADGTPGRLRLVLLDGRVTRQALPTASGLKGLFTDEQKYRYQGIMQVRIDYDPISPSQPDAHAEVESNGSFTAPEGMTLVQLEREMFNMIQQMTSRLDLEMQANMLRHMPGVVR